MGKKGWIIFSVAAVGLLAALFYFSGRNQVDVSDVDADSIIAASEQNGNIGDHVFGSDENKVVLVEYGDFQCPGCGSAHPRVKELTEKYEDQVTFVYRNLPLTSIHPNARAAAGAAEAAGLQGKYWDMNNLIFESQSDWENASLDERTTIFEGYAEQIGLDLEQFTSDLSSNAITQKINFDMAIAKKENVSSTPTFVLNGEVMDGEAWGSDEAFDAALQEAITAAGLSLPEDEE